MTMSVVTKLNAWTGPVGNKATSILENGSKTHLIYVGSYLLVCPLPLPLQSCGLKENQLPKLTFQFAPVPLFHALAILGKQI